MEWLDEYEKLVVRMNTPRVVIDNAVCPTATLVQVDSARKRGLLLEAVQVLADLDLSINKAYISSDGRWFMDVFHVTDRLGRKLTDDSVITYIQQSLGTWNEPARPAALEGLTALELTGPDRTGLLSEVFAVLADLQCGVVDARAWTHRGRLACVAFLRGEGDADRVARILARLGHLVRGDGEAPGAVAAVPAAAVAHVDRRLHQLMAADHNNSATPYPAAAVSVQSWAERGYSVVTVQCRDRPKLLFDVVCALHCLDYVVFHGTVDTAAGDRARQEFYIRSADGSPIRSEAERERLAQCLQAAIDRRSLEGVRLELCTPDRPGLLSEVTRTFRENGLLVAHAEVSTKGGLASNVFYVTDADGKAAGQSAIEAVRARVGADCLVVGEEPRPPRVFPEAGPGDRDHGGGGLGLVYLGNLVKRNLYNLGLIKSCS
ncbi:ACT domain-containing protein ACR8 [Zea mays]|uniref:ACT domain-containing protein ACR n=1 Tax=Zea mays TaxID=4577 RepID=A0A1D6PWW7_MAIZE|nr:ACT domain-containing protein ACR8 [Zea mays]AQK51026.1 ACR8 [Zea mays]